MIDVSLLEPLLTLLGPGPSVYDQLGIVPGRNGNRSPNNAPRNTYVTRDGRWVAISASATSIAERVMRLVGRPDIAEQPWFASARERVAHGDQLDGIVAGWIRARDFDEVMTAFQEAGAAIAPIYDVEQLVNDPQVEAPGRHHHGRRTRTSGRCGCRTCCSAWSRRRARSASPGAGSARTPRTVYARAARARPGALAAAARRRRDLMHRSYLFAPGHNAKLLARSSTRAPTR